MNSGAPENTPSAPAAASRLSGAAVPACAPLSSSAGRLFDGFAFALGLAPGRNSLVGFG